MLQQELVMCKSHTGGTGFEGMKESWRTAEAWHCESPQKAIGEGAVSVAVEGQGLNGSCNQVEAYHHEKSLRKTIDDNAV